jgi:hypothetical protein
MIRFAAALCCAVFLLSVGSPADARPRQQVAAGCNQLWPCEISDFFGLQTGDAKSARRARRGIAAVSARAASTVLGGRPSGCPARFCGCGASLHLFGRIIPSLNLAANWLRFPRAAPAPNMVAARRGHVFVLKEHIAGSVWVVHDSNSGGRRTRLHARSIAGYAIVNPSGAT